MDNKVMIQLIVPELETSYDVYIPISRRIGNTIALLVKAISDMGIEYEFNNQIALYNRTNGFKYNPNSLIYDTDIRNGSILVLI